jgi:hypothetical protein
VRFTASWTSLRLLRLHDAGRKAASRDGLIFWQEPQDHPLNWKKRKEQGAPEEPSAFRTPLLCRTFGSEAPAQERYGENGDCDEN